jgi:hypothetical protein
MAAGTLIPAFICPTTPPDRMYTFDANRIGLPGNGAAISDYQACSDTRFPGLGWIQMENVEGMPASLSDSSDDYFIRIPERREGIEYFGRQARIADITDGLSNTILLREWSESAKPFEISLERWTFAWVHGGEFHTFANVGRLKYHPTAAQALGITVGEVVRGTGPLHSGHNDGGFVAMCDASVQWIPNSMRINEIVAQFTREASDSGESYDQMLLEASR